MYILINILAFLSLFSISTIIFGETLETTNHPGNNCLIYIASSLFSARDKEFNIEVVNRLEKQNLKTILPQRNGFEFYDLQKRLANYLPKNEINKARQLIIYYLDVGMFLKNSNIVLAVLEEPLDPGVLVEMAYARMMGKYVIGIRSDARTPFGTPDDVASGMHIFSMMQLDQFVYFFNRALSIEQNDVYIKRLTDYLVESINSLSQANVCIKQPEMHNPILKQIEKGANILFNNIDLNKINSQESLNLVVKRYLANKNELVKIYPKIEILN